MRTLPGVLAASVSFSKETVYVCHDDLFMSERELVTKMAQRGYWLRPSFGETISPTSSLDAARLGAVLALLANVIGLALWQSARSAPRLPWIELVFALLMLGIAGPPLLRSVRELPRRSFWRAEVMALVTAGLALAIGLLGVFVRDEVVPLTPNFLLRVGLRTGGANAIAFESAAVIMGCAFLGHEVRRSFLDRTFSDLNRAIRRRYTGVRRILPQGGEEFVPWFMVGQNDRLRLVAGEVAKLDLELDTVARVAGSSGSVEDRSPGQTMFRDERLISSSVTGRVEHAPKVDAEADADAEILREVQHVEQSALDTSGRRVENVVTLALTLATVWFAALAVLVHGITGRQTWHPGIGLAGVAVLAGSAPTVFASSVSLLRLVAVMQARAMGFVVKNVLALEALASVDVALFELSGRVYLDAPVATRGLWHRAISCRLLSEECVEHADVLRHRFGMATSGNLDAEAKQRIVAHVRRSGGRVVHVGGPDTAQMLPVDVSIVVAPDTPSASTRASIICRNSRLTSLVWLIDLARALRGRTRLLLALTLIYEACVVPLCAAGLVAPLGAAVLALGVTLLACGVASGIGSSASALITQDKPHMPLIWPFSRVPRAQRSP